MIALFNAPYRPSNYSLQEVAMILECGSTKRRNRRKARQIVKVKPERKKSVFRNPVLVLNDETGIYYDCIKDAAKAVDLPRSTLGEWLAGRIKKPNHHFTKKRNYTSFKIV